MKVLSNLKYKSNENFHIYYSVLRNCGRFQNFIDLLEIISESPPTLQLYFEPKGKPQEDRKFYLAEKEDRCVVCGAKQNYIRKHVIPLEYRKLVICVCQACRHYCMFY